MAFPYNFFKLKKYLTLSEVAERLTNLFNETVTVIDVLELVLDQKLILSVKFPYGVKVIACKYGKHEELKSEADKRMFSMFYAPKKVWEDEEYYKSDEYKALEMEFLKKCHHEMLEVIKRQYADNDEQCKELLNKYTFEFYLNDVKLITDRSIGQPFYLDENIYDFPLVGTEKIWVENMISSLKNHDVIERWSIDGAFIADNHGNLLSIREQIDFETAVAGNKKGSPEYEDIQKRYRNLDSVFCYPADNFPEDTEFVITTKNLLEFEKIIFDETSNNEDINYNQAQLLVASILKILKDSNPKKWTQGELSDLISEQEQFKGLGKRKIDSFFSSCNKLLK